MKYTKKALFTLIVLISVLGTSSPIFAQRQGAQVDVTPVTNAYLSLVNGVNNADLSRLTGLEIGRAHV